MAFIYVKEKTHEQLNQFKAKYKLKSHDRCIQELLTLWETIP